MSSLSPSVLEMELFDKNLRTFFFLPLVAREFAIATAFLGCFLGFEGFKRLECDISWVQNEDEVKTKVFLKSSSRLHLPFKRNFKTLFKGTKFAVRRVREG